MMNRANSGAAPHVLPLRLYLTIGAVLLLLTGATVTIAQYDFGSWNMVIAMLIAGLKATLVALFFMHLKYQHKFYALAFVIAILLLVVFIVFTMFDTISRGEINETNAGTIREFAVIYDEDGKPVPFDERNLPAGTVHPEKDKPKEKFEILNGFGPLKEAVEVGELNTELATVGEDIFEEKCVSCHSLDDPEIGPPLRDVTFFRSPTFIMNQILDPDQNGMNHPEMIELRAEYDTTMIVEGGVTMDEARALLEYLRQEAEQAPEEEDEAGFTFE